ncbi:hypothetical protein H6G76_03830 [Nostoc sp. FACHB-152]|nr:hypothetical protein [Nostoc sp. FACHB-152]MBD2467602.1 hypothetical protein [Nostoc sp. FACHB-145]
MLQEFSTQFIAPEPLDELISDEPWSIEIYADGLMDDLFADIDDILDTSGHLSSHTVRYSSRTPQRSQEESTSDWYYSDYEPLQTLNLQQIVLPNTLNRTVHGVPQVRNKHTSTVVVDTPAVTFNKRRPKKIRLALSKLVILGTAIGVAIAGTIYWLQSGAFTFITAQLTGQMAISQAPLPTRADVEADLADYMLSSLAVIDQQAATSNQKSFRTGILNRVNSNPSSVAYASSPPVGNLPSPLTANNTPPAPNRSATNVVERIYIPVYQAPSPMRYGLPRLPGTPLPLPPVANARQTTQPNAVTTALGAVRPAAKPVSINMLAAVHKDLKPVDVRTTPITVRQSASPISALPVAPLRAAPPQVAAVASATTTQQVYVATNSAPAPSHTLEGVMELGNKSAALFQVDGVTRRINIGESIGTSGWTLVEVNNGEAIVRRNGEVRSIYTGQKL